MSQSNWGLGTSQHLQPRYTKKDWPLVFSQLLAILYFYCASNQRTPLKYTQKNPRYLNMAQLEKSPFKQLDQSLLLDTSANKSSLFKGSDKWAEIKFLGKSIKRRSYHSSVIYDSQLYVYGGYDINTGILADFHKIGLRGNAEWVDLTSDSKLYPGPRHGHSAIVYGKKMYLFGGKVSSLCSTNLLNVYDFEAEIWIMVNTSGEQPPNIDSHSAVVHEDKMYVFGGFLSASSGQYSNRVYVLDFDKLEWSQLSVSGKCPQPRTNSSIAVINGWLYIFGGSNLDNKFKDLWKLSLTTNKWQLVDTKQAPEDIPDKRAGHTLTAYSNKLLLFGGIQNVTHEKDDVFIFDTQTSTWKQIDNNQNSRHCVYPDENTNDEGQLPQSTKKIGELKSASGKVKKPITNKSTIDPASKSIEKQQKTQQLSKIDIRKQQLLSEFELTPEENQRYRNPSPTLESLKNSILSINPLNKKKVAEDAVVKQAIKKNTRKKPCARDGHSANLLQNQIVFLGGDRHMMSFNDMYLLSLDTLY